MSLPVTISGFSIYERQWCLSRYHYQLQ